MLGLFYYLVHKLGTKQFLKDLKFYW